LKLFIYARIFKIQSSFKGYIMIPKSMEILLKQELLETALNKRLIREDGLCFLEFNRTDELLLSRLGINCDKLGPELVVCMWDEKSELEIGGYLVVDNLSMGKPSMGGIRMLPDIVPSDIYNLARGMTLKNAAADLPTGGGKSGIIAKSNTDPIIREKIIIQFARMLRRYRDLYVPGPDVGTNDADMKTIAIENGLDSSVSKPADMGGNRIDELGAAAGGVATALLTLLEIIPRLRVLPQFANLSIPRPEELKVLIQGFGAVGAHVARILKERVPEANVIGISDVAGYLYAEEGLPVIELFNMWQKERIVTNSFYQKEILPKGPNFPIKFSTNPNNLLLENAFCFIPAAPIFNYVGVYPSEHPSMTADRIGNWSLIVEGANTYSPDPNRKAARTRMEQIVYREKGVMIATDYLVNSGGVIYAAQEYIIKTPEHLQIPKEMLGNKEKVNEWLKENAEEFALLSKKRLEAGEAYRKKVIKRNMVELVDILAGHPDVLPSSAAEEISVQRLTMKERERTAKDIMITLPTIDINSSIQDAAALIIKESSDIIAVLSNNKLVGVVTDWDITKATAHGKRGMLVDKIMTKDVVSVSPYFTILDIVRQLEQFKISAMPVVDNGKVLGKVSSDLIAQRFLLNLLLKQ
jgi:glutamate dehydrogenase/leucine dehydrogenase/CBS domain-containing protein